MMFLSKLKRLHGEATEANKKLASAHPGLRYASYEEIEFRQFLRNKAEAIIALVEAAGETERLISEVFNIQDGSRVHETLRAALSKLNAEES